MPMLWAHISPPLGRMCADAEREMSCEYCTDMDGLACFPTHGLAPHAHTKSALVFDLTPTPGFTPDDEDPTQGTWWCVHCEDGKPSNAGSNGPSGVAAKVRVD